MSATKRFMNWTGVSFTPVNGQPTAITGVTSVAIESGGSLARFAGDGDRYVTTMVNDFNEPTVIDPGGRPLGHPCLPGRDRRDVLGDPIMTPGTAPATGAVTYTLANAVVSACNVPRRLTASSARGL